MWIILNLLLEFQTDCLFMRRIDGKECFVFRQGNGFPCFAALIHVFKLDK